MKDSETNEKKLDNLTIGAKGGAIAFILKITSLILAFLNQIILARILGAEGLGQVLLAISVIYISSQIAKFGIEDAMMRFVPMYIERGDYKRLKGTIYFALKFCFFSSILSFLVVVISSDFIATRIFHSEGLIKLLTVAAVTLPATVMRGAIGGILKGYKDTFRALLPEFFISPFLRIVIFLLLLIKGREPTFAIYAFVSGEVFAVILSAVFLIKKTGIIKTKGLQCEYRKVLDVAFTMIFTALSLILFTQTDLWVIGMYTNTESVGIYGVVTKFVTLIILPLGIFSTIIPPLMSSIHTSGNIEELRRVVRESSRWILTASMPIILILIMEGELLLKYIFGEKFTAGYVALLILSIGQIVNSSTGLVGYLLQMTGGHRIIMKINIFWGILNVILNLILVPYLGINGAAISTAFCLAMGNITAVIAVHKSLSVFTLAKGIRFDILLAITVGILYLLSNNLIFFKHLILIGALIIYVSKSIIHHDIPWRLLFASFRGEATDRDGF
jgi:O-antigen/teichoic acid export membrane protein